MFTAKSILGVSIVIMLESDYSIISDLHNKRDRIKMRFGKRFRLIDTETNNNYLNILIKICLYNLSMSVSN